MYNDIEHDIVTLELPNVMFVCNKGGLGEEKGGYATHHFMAPLIHKLAKARPQWKFYGLRYSWYEHDANLREVHTFRVFHNNELLGDISKDYNYSGNYDTYSITNARMEKARQRGSGTITKDVNKAFRVITKQFYTKTTDELIAEARTQVSKMVSTVVSDRNWKFQRTKHALESAAWEFARTHWAAFAEVAAECGVGQEMIDAYPSTKEEYEGAVDLQESFQGKGATVVIRDNDYIVSRGSETTIMSHEELPSHLKRGIGLLKLAEPNTYIPHVGVKTPSESMFIIFKEGETNE